MAKGGYRPNAGRPKGAKNKATIGIPGDVRKAAKKAGVTPLEYMLGVMNDDEADGQRRDRMAVAAAPFVHAKADMDTGKKAQQQANAEKAAAESIYAPRGPRLAVDNG